MKRHQADDFLMTHAVDGYSLALDFKVTKKNRTRLWALMHRMDQVVLNAGGRFYFAKDSSLERSTVEQYFGPKILAKFKKLKKMADPDNLLQTELSGDFFR